MVHAWFPLPRNAPALTVCVLLSASLPAQTVSGTVRAGGIAVPGVLVSLVDSRDSIVTRSLTDPSGRYRLMTPVAGTYRVRTLRIGFRPAMSDTMRLPPAATRVFDVNLDAVALALSTVRIVGTRSCVDDAAGAPETFAVWEQARAALAATILTRDQASVRATRLTFQRVLDAGGRRVLAQDAAVGTGTVGQPWVATPAESLRARGYVVEQGDSTAYRAPGLELLASAAFLSDHCFRLVASPADSLIGVAFEPAPTRQRVSEIAGTLWLHRASAELRSLEYRFVNVSREVADAEAGGGAAFARLANGGWLITKWHLRMPVIAWARGPGLPRVAARAGAQPQVTSVMVVGGELVAVTSNESPIDTLWMGARLTLRGIVSDSATGAPIAAAELTLPGFPGNGAVTDAAGTFAISSVFPGNYTIEIRTPSLDSVNALTALPLSFADTTEPVRIRVPNATQLAVAMCGVQLSAVGAAQGIVFGTVRRANDSTPVPNATLVAEWIEGPSQELRWKDGRSDARGNYRFCGIPVGRTVVVRAANDSGSAEPVVAAIAANRRFTRAELAIDPSMVPTASFVGTVMADTVSPRPLGGAEVAIPALAKSVRSDARGAFRLRDIPPGNHEVTVRKIGFGAAVDTLAFVSNGMEQRRVVLSPMTTLNEVVVTAERRDPRMDLFEAHRRLGLGQFLTRADIAPYEWQSLGGILRRLASVDVQEAGPGRAYVATTRGPKSVTRRCYAREQSSIDCNRCYPAVYLDGIMLYSGRESDYATNINNFPPHQVEAIELYVGPAQVPAEYSGLNTVCGVLVIHTRRR